MIKTSINNLRFKKIIFNHLIFFGFGGKIFSHFCLFFSFFSFFLFSFFSQEVAWVCSDWSAVLIGWFFSRLCHDFFFFFPFRHLSFSSSSPPLSLSSPFVSRFDNDVPRHGELPLQGLYLLFPFFVVALEKISRGNSALAPAPTVPAPTVPAPAAPAPAPCPSTVVVDQ